MIQLLGEIGENICYAGKGVDLNDPIQPVQLPRGHGGVAILWNKTLDKFITSLPDGGERIQCIQFKDQHYPKPVLIVSAYFPTRGVNSDDQYMDCLVQLEEILNKYIDSHLNDSPLISGSYSTIRVHLGGTSLSLSDSTLLRVGLVPVTCHCLTYK